MVVFVGDKPSNLNDNPNVAFVGTPSYKNLLKWIKKMEIKDDDYVMINSDTPVRLEHAMWMSIHGHEIVALGNIAAKRLSFMDVVFYKLPHPSPRNRKLNDQNFIDSELEKCKNYLRGTK